MAGTWKRAALSAFVLAHLAAVSIWVMPDCELKQRLAIGPTIYLVPLGLAQNWGMFAPEPPRDTSTLEAVVVDSRGLMRSFAFPKQGDKSPWQAIWFYRHAKLASNMSQPDFPAAREFAARYVVRRLGLTAADFPADVQLVYQVRPNPPPGSPPADSMTPPIPTPIETFRFPTLEEAVP